MTDKERDAVRSFTDRLEAFLLTHDDDHPVLAGDFGHQNIGGCPIAQITGLYDAGLCASALANEEVSFTNRMFDALTVFIDTYDYQMGAYQQGKLGKVIACSLGKARPAIRKAIEKVKIKFGIEAETQVPVEEPEKVLVGAAS